MEILQEDILKLIRSQCSSHWELEIYKGHIIINLTATQPDYRSVYQEIKEQVTKYVLQHFPERETELIFEVRKGSWNSSFKIGNSCNKPLA